MARVNRTFSTEPTDVREWTRYLSGLFFTGSFATELGGCDTIPSGTARYTVSAGIVCLSLPTLTATSNDVFALLTGLPSEITPDRDQTCVARIVDNGVTAMGLVLVGTDTGLTLYPDLDNGFFTGSGTKGIKGSKIVYPLD